MHKNIYAHIRSDFTVKISSKPWPESYFTPENVPQLEVRKWTDYRFNEWLGHKGPVFDCMDDLFESLRREGAKGIILIFHGDTPDGNNITIHWTREVYDFSRPSR